MFSELWNTLLVKLRLRDEPLDLPAESSPTQAEPGTITSIPPGNTTIELNVKNLLSYDEVIAKLMIMEGAAKAMEENRTQAKAFERKVRNDHRVPDITDANTWKAASAFDIVVRYQPSGHFMIMQVFFRDGSHWTNPANKSEAS